MKNLKNFRFLLHCVVLVIAFAVFSPLLLLLGNQYIRDKALQQLVFKVIAEKVTGDETEETEKALALFRYIHQHLYTPPDTDPGGRTLLEVLIRNIAWCNRQADILSKFARAIWIDGGYVTLYGYDDVSHHTVCVLKLHGELRMLDPFHGYVFYDKEGKIASLEALRNDWKHLKSSQFEAVRHFIGQEVDDYFKLFEKTHDWKVHIPSAPIWLKYMDYYYDAFGDWFLNLYLDLYFKRSKTDLLTRARIKQLTWRFESALEDYDRILKSDYLEQVPVLQIDYEPVTRDILEGESSFFRAQTYFDMGRYDLCAQSLEDFIRRYPESRWKKLACYYLGRSYEEIGNFHKAIFWYSVIKGIDETPAPEKLAALLERTTSTGPEILKED